MPFTFDAGDLLDQVQAHLIEVENRGVSWSSGQWTPAEALAILNQQVRAFLKDTCAVVDVTAFALTLPAGTFPQTDGWLATWYVSWGTAQLVAKRSLERGDRAEVDLLLLPATGTRPRYYIEDDAAGTLLASVAPVPAVAGHGTQYFVKAGTTLDDESSTVEIPDILAMGAKWATLAQMLAKIGRGADPERAQLAWQRRTEMVEACRVMFLGFA